MAEDSLERLLFADLLGAVGEVRPIRSALIPECAAFSVGLKPSLRLVVPDGSAERFAEVSTRHGLAMACRAIEAASVSSDWAGIRATTGSTPFVLLALHRDLAAADALAEAELGGQSSSVGTSLGYPRCCIAGYETYAGPGWAAALIARSGTAPWPVWANRLTEAWGAGAPLGELFPCRLDCPRAIAYGQANDRALRQLGAARLADELVRQSMVPLVLRADGSVDRWRDSEIGVRLEFHA